MDEDTFRKEREELKRKIIARQIGHLPMVKQWQSILVAASVLGVIVGGLLVIAIRLLTAFSVGWAQNVHQGLVFGISFGVVIALMILYYLVEPSAKAMRRSLAYAQLGQTCLELEEYETAILNDERAVRELAIEARSNPTVKPTLGAIYARLGLAHCVLGHYQESHMYYSLAQQTFPDQAAKDSAFLEMALVDARRSTMQMQAQQKLLAVLKSTRPDESYQAVRCLAALAALAVVRSDLDSFVSYRTEAIRYGEGRPLDEALIQYISLLGLLCSDIGDVQGAAETTACARRFSKQMNITVRPIGLPVMYEMSKPGSSNVLMTYERQRNEQVIARASAMLSESIAKWLCEDHENAVDLARNAARDLRERHANAIMNHRLRKWEVAAMACLGRIVANWDESEPFWPRYYAFGRRPFVLLDDLATDDLDFHDYVGYGLSNLLGVEDALKQERILLDEGQQQKDSSEQIAHLIHISAIYQTAHDWPLARQYQAQALEMARSQGSSLSYLACILRQIALILQENQVTRKHDDLDPMISEARSLLSHTDDAYYRAWGLSKLGAICFAAGKADDAVECYREAIQVAESTGLMPLEMDVHLQLGTVYEEQGSWGNALNTYTDVQLLVQRCPFVPIQALRSGAGRARCLWHLRRPEETLQECQSYLQLNSHVSTESVKRIYSAEIRPRERDVVNDVMVRLLYEDFGNSIRTLEQVEYAKTARTFSFDKLTAFLRQQTIPITVAEYYATQDYTLLFVVDSTRCDLSVYQISISLQRILDCVDLLTEEVYHYHQWQAELDSTWQELAQPLMEPLFAHLDGQSILYVIPHGPLHYLPFHAIQHEGRYFIDCCPVVYAPSVAVMMQSHSRLSQTWTRAVVVGNPNRDLRSATTEVREVAKLFNTVPRVGHDAKFDLHRERIDTDVLHIASHGLFDPEQLALSGILLADELLTIPKISEMSIRANLVTLSACETGLSKVAPGNQLVGLTNAFLQVGVPSLLVSLWKADDRATSELMVIFYTQLRSGAPSVAHALRSAQLNIRQSSSWSHPYFWAPFILIGHWH